MHCAGQSASAGGIEIARVAVTFGASCLIADLCHLLGARPAPGLHVIFGPCICRLQIMLGARGVDRSVYGPYLLLLEPEQLAVLAMHRCGG